MYEREEPLSSSSFQGGGDMLSSIPHRDNLEPILEIVLGRLRDAIQRTVVDIPSSEKQDRCFLPNGDLEEIIDSSLLAQLFGALLTDADSVGRCIAMTASRKKLLALFIYQNSPELLDLFMEWLKSNGDDAPSDDSMPFSSMSLHHHGVSKRLHDRIIRDQTIFTPITIRKDQDSTVGPQNRLPFISGKRDFMNSSLGTIYEAAIAERHFATEDGSRIVTANPDGATAIALKVFDHKQIVHEATIEFQVELRILRDIRSFNMKREAFMLDWGSLTVVDDVGNPMSHYLMFEPATFSLADFLDSEACARTWATKGQSLLLAKLVDIVDAIASLHDQLGILHLNIKPENIMVSWHEARRNSLTWRLSDFGLARRIGGRQRVGYNASKLLSDATTISDKEPAGTYQGPEIYKKDSSRAVRGSDMWSIGCVALQVLAFITGGPYEVSELHNSLPVDFLHRDGRLRLFYIRSDTHSWKVGDVVHYRYEYLKNHSIMTGQIPGTQLQAAINPKVIVWSNILHEAYKGEAEQKFIRQYLELIFCSVLLINCSKRISAAHLHKELQVIQSRWKSFEDDPDGRFRYENPFTSTTIFDRRRQKTSISNLYSAIESNNAITAWSELKRDVGQLKRYCLGSSRFPVHCAIHCKAYDVLTVILEFSDAEAVNLVCEDRTALEFACDGGGDARALEVMKQFHHKFDFSDGNIYMLCRKPLNSDARKALEDLKKTSIAGMKTKSRSLYSLPEFPFLALASGGWNETSSSGPIDATSDIDQGLPPAACHESSLPDETSFDHKETIMFDVEANTRLLETESIKSSDGDLTQHKAPPNYGEPIDQIEPVHAQIDVQSARSLPIESVVGHEDGVDLLGTRNGAFSTDDTLVRTPVRTLESLIFNINEHYTLSPKDLKNGPSDVASLLSKRDASKVGSSTTLVEYQHATTGIIAKAFLEKNELFRTYREVIEVVGTDRFLRNNARLLQEFSADLRLQQHLPSEALIVQFLATTAGRRLVSAAICDELYPNKDLRPQRQLDSMEDKKVMLNWFLGDINSAVQSKPTESVELNMLEEVDTEGDLSVKKRDDDVASMKSMSDGELETTMPTDEKLESLEETVRVFMSGRPIELYQEKLQQWQDLFMQPSQDDLEPVETIGNTSKEANEHSLGTEMRSQPVANAVTRDEQDKIPNRSSEPTAPTDKADEPLIVSKKGNIRPVNDGLGGELIPLAAQKNRSCLRQVETSLPNFGITLPPSLPLLVDKVLRYLPISHIEPSIPEGKIRVRWISVGSITR